MKPILRQFARGSTHSTMIAAILIVVIAATAQVQADLPTKEAFLEEVKEALANVKPAAALCNQKVQQAQENGTEVAALFKGAEDSRRWGKEQIARLEKNVTAYQEKGAVFVGFCSMTARFALEKLIEEATSNIVHCVKGNMYDVVMTARVADSDIDRAAFFWKLAQKEVALPDDKYGGSVPFLLQESHKLAKEAENNIKFIDRKLADLTRGCEDYDAYDVDRILNYASKCMSALMFSH